MTWRITVPIRSPSRTILIGVSLMVLARTSPGAVVEATPTGFLIEHEVAIQARPEKVYTALIHVERWWAPMHTYSGNSMNLSIDPTPGGCFCEHLGSGGAVEHMRVINVQPNKLLRMSGALGPLQASGLAGSLTWMLVPGPTATTLRLSYSVGGYLKGGADKMAPVVDRVLGEQIQRLKAFVEGRRAS